ADVYFHADDQFNVMALTDATGDVVERYEYGDFGRPLFFDGAGVSIGQSLVGNPYLFTGRRYDNETGFYYYRARYMEPRSGRFTTRDPLGYIDGLNLFAYVGQNPFRWLDPFGFEKGSWLDGLQEFLDWAGFAPGVGAVPDLLNAGVSAARGNWAEAGLNAVAAVPLFGDAVKGVDKANDVRKVIDKSWKDKIHGTAQKTGTPGHQFRMYREAITEAKKPNVKSVHLDHGYNRALDLDPKTISPNRRPDVVSVYDDNTVRRVEVQSKTDRPSVLRSRNSALDPQLRDNGYTPTPPVVVRPTQSPGSNIRFRNN
ncbi:MAG: RHS repeat-associated core domain-containing protein, partial [Verrucomicrobiota bacterium]